MHLVIFLQPIGRRVTRSFAALAFFDFLMWGLAAPLPAAAAMATITLLPPSGPPTTTIKVAGSGYGSSETVSVKFDAAQEATRTTSSGGSFSASFNVPKVALPGNHQVSATGQTSKLSASANFLVQTDWAKFHSDRANSGVNPYENVLGPANIAKLNTLWTGATSGMVQSSPAIVNGVAYLGGLDAKLYAFDAAGITGCAGTPAACVPLWFAYMGAGTTSSPAVADLNIFVGSYDNKLYAFSVFGCNSPPCSPEWTGATGGFITSSPVVAGGVVYVGSNDTKLYAFKEFGCGSATCSPLWTGW